MNDLQKMLELVLNEEVKGKGDEWSENPLLKIATEYLYEILEGLEKDHTAGKLPVPEEMKETVKKCFDDNNIDIKLNFLGVNCIARKAMKIKHAEVLFKNKAIIDYINSPSFWEQHKDIENYDLKSLHQKVCKYMFTHMGDSGNNEISVWVGVEMDEDSDEVREDEVAWLEMISEMEDGRSIPLAIVSQDILNYDGYVFERLQTGSNEIKEIIREMYRPYLVEYYIDPKELGEKQSDFLRQMCQEKTWYKAELVDANTDTKGGIAFQGVFVHTASPVEYEGKKLVIGGTIAEQKDLNKIKNTYNMAAVTCALDTDVQKELANLFKGVRFQTAKVYNVGNGNCIYFYGKKECREKRFFYDIGFDMHVHIGDDPRMMEQEYRVALQDIRESKPDCIILSHWDEDHFRGCAYAEKELFDTRWIAPGINSSEKKANAKRFLLYLYYIGSLMVVDRNAVSARAIAISHSNKSKMTLYVGKRQSGTDRKITKCNCEGVAICMEDGAFLRGSKIRCLMQGDVPYMSLPPAARTNKTNHYDYLVAPHHGAEMDCSSLSAHGKKDGQAVICCTGETGKNRPNEAHLEELQNCYAGVKTTAQANEYIQLDLRRKNRMRIDGKR